MRKIAYLVLALAAGCVYACSADKSASPTTEAGSKSGSVNLALVSTTKDGRTFRLDNASFKVTSANDLGSAQTISAPGEATALQFDLPVGTYNVELLSGWQLSEVLPGGVVQKVDATVSGSVQLTVSADATTDAVFHFQLVEGSGQLGTGRITFDVGTTCTPKASVDCHLAGIDCGPMSDGCGGTIDCGNCAPGSTCNQGKCVCPANPSCASLGAECGSPKDVCGNAFDCGACDNGGKCNASYHCECVPQTCGDRVCGPLLDGCGKTLDCGTCPAGSQCTPAGKCEAICVPATKCTAACGTEPDGCGGFIDCGACPDGQTCTGGVCKPACNAKTCATLGYQCGSHQDNCGDSIDCGLCPSPADTCTPEGLCLCQPKTSCAPGECGELPDGCGGVITCGCPTGQTCESGQCICTKKTCGSNNCDIMSDGCGGQIDCGKCTTGTTCQNNACVCQPTTCQALGIECDSASDGCGGMLTCGTCGSGKSCNAGKCVDNPQVTITYKLSDGSPWNPNAAGGYCVNFTITNSSSQDTKSWTATVALGADTKVKTNFWGATKVDTAEGIKLTALNYNAKITKSGGKIDNVGYCADFTKGYHAPSATVAPTF